MKFIESNPQDQDDELVSFLKTYSPTPPKETKPCQELLMRSIETSVISAKNGRAKKWLLPSTIISTLLILLGYMWNVHTRSTPQFATETEKLEAFMVETWYGAMTSESSANH